MASIDNSQVFTTGQVSKICQVAPRTVSKWFDSGRLQGYRIPGSNDRRVPRENLVVFMKEHGIPLGPLAPNLCSKVLLVGIDRKTEDLLRTTLPADRYEIRAAATLFEAGSLTTGWNPSCLVIDVSLGRNQVEEMAQVLRRSVDEQAPKLIALLSSNNVDGDIDPSLFDDRFRPPYDTALLAARIQQACGLADAAAVGR